MVFHNDIQPQLAADVFLKLRQSVRRRLLLILKSFLRVRRGVHANGMAAEKFGGIGPLEMILHRLAPPGCMGFYVSFYSSCYAANGG